MALVYAETFEGLADGVALTTANTAFDEILMAAGRTFTAETTGPIDGSVSGLITHGGTAGNARVGWPTASLSISEARLVVKAELSAVAGGDDFCRMDHASGVRSCAASVTSAGAVQCYPNNSGNLVTSSTGLIVAATPFRLEMYYRASDGYVECRVWSTADSAGAADATLVPTGNGATTNPYRIGATWFSTATSGTIKFDAVELFDNYWASDIQQAAGVAVEVGVSQTLTGQTTDPGPVLRGRFGW